MNKLLLDHPDCRERFFARVVTIEEVLTDDRMREETKGRVAPLVAYRHPLPRAVRIVELTRGLSRELSGVDCLVYATAVENGLAVVSGDLRLARQAQRSGLRIANFALLMREWVESRRITERECDGFLAGLAKRGDYLLPRNGPQNWRTLQRYDFP